MKADRQTNNTADADFSDLGKSTIHPFQKLEIEDTNDDTVGLKYFSL